MKISGAMIMMLGVDRAEELTNIVNHALKCKNSFTRVNEQLNTSIGEQEELIVEIEDFYAEMNKLQSNQNTERQSMIERLCYLNDKQEKGTITEEETEELNALNNKLADFDTESQAEMNNLSNSINNIKSDLRVTSEAINNASDLISKSETAVSDLTDWNSKNSEENGGGTVCKTYIEKNTQLANNLNTEINNTKQIINIFTANQKIAG